MQLTYSGSNRVTPSKPGLKGSSSSSGTGGGALGIETRYSGQGLSGTMPSSTMSAAGGGAAATAGGVISGGKYFRIVFAMFFRENIIFTLIIKCNNFKIYMDKTIYYYEYNF